MKPLWLFCALAGLLLGSAAPPPSSRPIARPDAPPATTGTRDATPFDAAIDAGADALPTPVPMSPPTPVVARKAPVEPPEAAPAGAAEAFDGSGVRIVISLPQQKAYVFRDGVLFATSPVSTGRRGHETPAGTFRILEKKVRHRSNRYANAPMPYMQRLTWYGIALHAGRLPGYPASHGCIRLPTKFAKKLYGITDFSTEVTVTGKRPKSAAAALAIA